MKIGELVIIKKTGQIIDGLKGLIIEQLPSVNYRSVFLIDVYFPMNHNFKYQRLKLELRYLERIENV